MGVWGEEMKGLNLIVCVVGVDRARIVQRTEEKKRGKEGSLWVGKWDIISPTKGANDEGDEGEGEVGCQVQLWEWCARDWGDQKVRRGDVVLLESEYLSDYS